MVEVQMIFEAEILAPRDPRTILALPTNLQNSSGLNFTTKFQIQPPNPTTSGAGYPLLCGPSHLIQNGSRTSMYTALLSASLRLRDWHSAVG